MKIALLDVDGKIPNLALMKLARFHRDRGDSVEMFTPLFSQPDRLYASKIFTFSPDNDFWPDCEIVKGGTGYDITSRLDPDVEGRRPDYSIYPECDYAIGFSTRGCIRSCEFCVVPTKEGILHIVGDLYDIWEGQPKLMLLDNNLTAARGHFETILRQMIKERVAVDFSQGLDVRIVTEEQAILLRKVRLWKRIHFAWDNPADEERIVRGIETLGKAFTSFHDITVYVLIGFNTTREEDLHRVMMLRNMGVDPFIMPYNRNDPYQRKFARWVNHKAIFKTVEWSEYVC